MATDEPIKGKRDTPASDSQPATTKMGQHKHKVALVYHRLSLLDNGSSRHAHGGDGFKHMDEELANVAGKQFVALDDCDNPYGDVGYGPTRIVRPESVQNGQGKFPGSRIKPGAMKTSTKKHSLGLTKTYKTKRGRPAGFKSAKGKIKQKPALSDSSCGWSNYSNGDKDNYFEPPTPMRRSLARSKSARRKTEQEPLLVDSSGSSSEGMKDKDDDFQPECKIKNLVDFKIVIGDGLLVLPDNLRRAYYELCQAQKANVHRNLLKHLNHELTKQLIVETANIAVGIKASSLASIDDLAGWKRTLDGLESMGMDVTFMRKRIDELLGLVRAPSQASVVPEGYEAVKLERDRAAEELRAIELRVSILKDSLNDMDVKMKEIVEASARKKEEAVRKLATAPW